MVGKVGMPTLFHLANQVCSASERGPATLPDLETSHPIRDRFA